jgi:aminoglycoside phosphotransferase (APT) family kinase protein
MASDRAQPPGEWERAFAFVEETVGGRIVDAKRQPRWRPAWLLEVERPDGEIAPIYLRGARPEAAGGADQLRHEYRCLRILESHDVPVPHVYGFCEEPEAIVMRRAPGRIDLSTAESEAERKTVRDHYMEILAGVHRIDVSELASAGLEVPRTAEALGLGDLESWVAGYRRTKRRPEPLIEFAVDWLRRNVPRDRKSASFLVGDSGQFLFERGRVTALIDLELAYVGDPAADLGALLCRDLSEPLGDLSDAIRTYERLIGEPVDRRVVLYHAIRFGIVTPLATAVQVAAPVRATDFVQYLVWHLVYARCPLELIAHLEGVEVPKAELPEEALSPWSIGHDVLRDRLAALERDDPFETYQLDALRRTAEYLRRADRHGPALEAIDLDEAGALLGRRPASWQERDRELESLVQENDGERDAELLRYFVRRVQRQEFLVEPVAKELRGVRMQRLDD